MRNSIIEIIEIETIIETLEKGDIYAQRTQYDITRVVLMFLLLTLNIFHTFFSVSTVYFEQVNVCWVLWEILLVTIVNF